MSNWREFLTDGERIRVEHANGYVSRGGRSPRFTVIATMARLLDECYSKPKGASLAAPNDPLWLEEPIPTLSPDVHPQPKENPFKQHRQREDPIPLSDLVDQVKRDLDMPGHSEDAPGQEQAEKHDVSGPGGPKDLPGNKRKR